MAETRPVTAFNFKVSIKVGKDQKSLCDMAFSECNGLEMSMSPKTIREGGNNRRMIHLPGPVSYGQLSLKRGVTADLGLWTWFERSQRKRELRATADVVMLGSDRNPKPTLHFHLTGCLPIKLRAPTLNAKDGQIAIEEVQIAYETLSIPKAVPKTGS